VAAGWEVAVAAALGGMADAVVVSGVAEAAAALAHLKETDGGPIILHGSATLDRNLSDAWLNKGFLRIRRGDGRDALPLLQEGISRGPDRAALAIFARGVAYEQMGQFDSAYVDLKRAHDLEPRWQLPREYLARYQVVTR